MYYIDRRQFTFTIIKRLAACFYYKSGFDCHAFGKTTFLSMIDQQPIKYQYVFVSTQKGILEYRNLLFVKTTF